MMSGRRSGRPSIMAAPAIGVVGHDREASQFAEKPLEANPLWLSFWIFAVSLSRLRLRRQTPPSRGNELGNAHEIVGDEIEHEVSSGSCDAPMLGFAHRAVLLAPTEDAFGHLSTGLRDPIADVAGRARIDRAPAPLAGLGEAVVLRNMRCDAHQAQRRNVVAGIVGLVLADGDAL